MTLLALQTEFRDWLKIGSDEQAGRFPTSVRAGLDIYQNNYRAQLVGCLEESFPVTLAWLGGAAFHTVVVAHVDAVPPSSWTLDLYPRDFPATVRNLYPDDPEVADLAMLELALAEAFIAIDAPPLAVDLAAVDWDHAQFEFVPSLAVHSLTTNAPAIWSAIIAGTTPPPAAVLSDCAALIVWRSDETCRFRSIARDERDAVAFLSAPGATFGSFCNARPTEVAEIGQWLGQWIADEIIASIEAS
jgi:hypothetical protein